MKVNNNNNVMYKLWIDELMKVKKENGVNNDKFEDLRINRLYTGIYNQYK